MKLLFGSEMTKLVIHFYDYIQSKYHADLELREFFDEEAQKHIMAIFIDENSADFNHIQQEKIAFLKDPFNDRYGEASWTSGQVTSSSYNWKKVLHHFNSNSFNLKYKKFTLFLTALCVVVYLLQLIGFSDVILNSFHFPANEQQDTEFWRYFTHTLVHLSPLHILFNLTWWWIFGGAIERQLGTHKILSVYLISGILSGIVQNYFSGYAFFGLSGVVYAVLGYVFILDKFEKTNKFDVPSGFFTMLVVGIAFGFISPLIGVNMGNAAHITGLITGLILGGLHCKFKVF